MIIFDLEGFSNFFSQPDVQNYVPKFINHILECMDIIISGGNAYWMEIGPNETEQYDPMPAPIHTKYLGDGMMYVWKLNEFNPSEIVDLFNRLWNLKNSFNEVIKTCSDDVPVSDIPNRIRFGIAAGNIYRLTYKGSRKEEYIGYSINLAARLQNYCNELGFIISARAKLAKKEMDKFNYIKVLAKNIIGMPNEIVYIDKDEFDALDAQIKSAKFSEL